MPSTVCRLARRDGDKGISFGVGLDTTGSDCRPVKTDRAGLGVGAERTGKEAPLFALAKTPRSMSRCRAAMLKSDSIDDALCLRVRP